MSRSLSSRLVAQSIFGRSPAATMHCPLQHSRFLSQTARRLDDEKVKTAAKPRAKPQTDLFLQNVFGSASSSRGRSPQASNSMDDLAQSSVFRTFGNSKLDTSALSGDGSDPPPAKDDGMEPYHLHVFSHKHNTHITCTKPNREPIISMSCGNIGYRKSRRGTFDSAYSLTKYVLERLIHTGWPMKIQRLELVLRGFGQGREAAVKVLMSPEGKVLREKIVRVADSTRIKFGGTRSEKPRRL